MYDQYVKDIMKLYDKEEEELEELENKNNKGKVNINDDFIHTKYDKLLNELNNKYNIIFRYDLQSCYGEQISTLIITSEKKNNMWCVYNNDCDEIELENAVFTINPSFVEKIIKDFKYKLDKIEFVNNSNVLDGTMNVYYYCIDGVSHQITCTNLWAWADNINDEVKTMLDFHQEIYDFLSEIDINAFRCIGLGE